MNLQNYSIEFDESLNDWKVFGDIEDDSNSYVGSFGESGTLVGPWWVRQDDGFQLSIVQQYAVEIARQLVGSFSGGINLQEFSIVKVSDTNDWKILGNIEDNDGNILKQDVYIYKVKGKYKDGNPIYREDGKVMKGPNYFKPNISKIIS